MVIDKQKSDKLLPGTITSWNHSHCVVHFELEFVLK